MPRLRIPTSIPAGTRRETLARELPNWIDVPTTANKKRDDTSPTRSHDLGISTPGSLLHRDRRGWTFRTGRSRTRPVLPPGGGQDVITRTSAFGRNLTCPPKTSPGPEWY